MEKRKRDMGEGSRDTQSPPHSNKDLTRLLHQRGELNKENNQLDRKSGETCINEFEQEMDKIIKEISTKLDKRKDVNAIKDIDLIKELLKRSCESLELEKLESDSDYLHSLARRKEEKISNIKKEIEKTSNKLRKVQLESEKDLLESDKSTFEKEMYICNQERSILLEVRMLGYNWQKYGEHNQSGQETHYREEDLLRKLGDLGRKFQFQEVHRKVLRDWHDTQNKLKSSGLSQGQCANLECSRKVLQEHSEVLQKLYDIEYKLRHRDLEFLSEEHKGLQEAVQELQWQSKLLENRSNTLEKYSEVVQKWWEMLQTADKIEHVLNEVDQANENTDLYDHREFLKKRSIELEYHKYLIGCFDRQIPKELKYSEKLYDKEKDLLCYITLHSEGQSSSEPTSETALSAASLDEKKLEKCFVRQERKLDDLVKYVMFLQKSLDFMIEIYDNYNNLRGDDMSVEEHTDQERHLKLMEEVVYKLGKSWDKPMRYSEKKENPDSLAAYLEAYRAEKEYKYNKTSCDLLLIYGYALQDLLDNQNKLKRPDLLPEEREYREIQNSICERACKIGEKQQQILLDELNKPAPWYWSDDQETLFKIATVHLDYLKDLWQQKSAIASSFSENPQSGQAIIQQHRDWEKAFQEREKCVDALAKFHKTPGKSAQLIREVGYRDHPKWCLLVLWKENSERLVNDCCKSDNDEHLQKVKSGRVKLIEAVYSDLNSSKNPAELRKGLNMLAEWSEKLIKLDKMDSSSRDYRKTLQSIKELEESYYNWEKGTPSTPFNTGILNILESFGWKGFR